MNLGKAIINQSNINEIVGKIYDLKSPNLSAQINNELTNINKISQNNIDSNNFKEEEKKKVIKLSINNDSIANNEKKDILGNPRENMQFNLNRNIGLRYKSCFCTKK